MDISKNAIQKRQYYYSLGRKFEKENNINEAIKTYKEYSTYLADEDKHIPHKWISSFYEQLGDIENSLFHLEEFAKGCSAPKAAEVFKELGENYLKLGNIYKAILNFEAAIHFNPNIGVKKKIDELKNSLS